MAPLIPDSGTQPQTPIIPISALAGSNVYIASFPTTSSTTTSTFTPIPPPPPSPPTIQGLPYTSLILRIIYPLPHELSTDPIEREKSIKAVEFWNECMRDLPGTMGELVNGVIGVIYPGKEIGGVIRRKQCVTVKLRDYDGLAATHDDCIDISLKWIHSHVSSQPPNSLSSTFEFSGVLCHELVHIYQHDGQSTAPGWWVEGFADYVRLRCGWGAKHWGEEGQGGGEEGWREGYQVTGFFLGWLERQEQWRFGDGDGERGGSEVGLVTMMNMRLEKERWPGGQGDGGEGGWWNEMTGYGVKDLWGFYKAATK